MDRYRMVLADDHVLIRQALGGLIKGVADLEVIGEAGDGIELLSLRASHPPDYATWPGRTKHADPPVFCDYFAGPGAAAHRSVMVARAVPCSSNVPPSARPSSFPGSRVVMTALPI